MDPEVTGLGEPQARPDHDAVAAAIERRLQAEREQAAAVASTASFDGNHEKRQEFRRMIDPGILRPNPRHIALESLETLLKLAENIIAHPDEVKYQRFKPTNATIKRTLVEPRGTLEYAVALGFHPEVDNFQPFYVWHKRHWNDLQIGAAMIKEALARENIKEVHAQRKREEEKAAQEVAKAKVKQAFYDDRKGRAMIDERERALRAAEAARRAAGGMSPEPEPADYRPRRMPGSGHTLSGDVIDADDGSDEGDAAARDHDDDDE
ncbi:hypothetical protein L226DRAFT_529545 [Lentinus tigrinus ALCF2SS1-7]|uniref:PUB domain-containing protein n=1 Tax=Lentinus tigrinus ALCF2SS1-6 TaxID=1328759 RepID=A0A5C2T5A0_9APHY|nr:hypothetical protein L227DRAFT_648270 [Lentinus tigrinus ALCF2SS1-6]RPD81098.1 hypothetical protein L226DRAFT_529545 [Lentinus tigrinus ALCF2SS1-7]